MCTAFQKSSTTASSVSSNTFVVRNVHPEEVVSHGDDKHDVECASHVSSHLPQARGAGINGVKEQDSDDVTCIPDTQFIEASPHLCNPPSEASSPDVEMIPDTPDGAPSTGVRKSFQRSYLVPTINLTAGGGGFPQRKMSPPRHKKLKGKRQLSNQASLPTKTTEHCMDTAGDPCDDFSPSILRSSAATHLPYPSCNVIDERCATDPLPLSKRCDHKVTPTKTVPSTRSDVIYGTVPGRLFQEALNREKRQHVSSPRRSKENRKLNMSAAAVKKLSDLDGDPMLLEVLAELKVESPKNETSPNVLVERSLNSKVCDGVSGYGTVDKHPEIASGDADLEDILGELRQSNGFNKHPLLGSNVTGKIQSNDVTENPSSSTNHVENPSFTNPVPLCSSSVNVSEDRNLSVIDNCSIQKEAKDIRESRSNDVENSSSLTNDVKTPSLLTNDIEIPSSFTTPVPPCSSSINVLEDRNLRTNDKDSVHQEVKDFMPTELKLEERIDNSDVDFTKSRVKNVCSEAIERRSVGGVLASCLPQSVGDNVNDSVSDDVNDSKVYEDVNSAKCDPHARYISDYFWCFDQWLYRLGDRKSIWPVKRFAPAVPEG